MSESFAELFEESLKTVDMQPGAIVTGVLLRLVFARHRAAGRVSTIA